MMKGRNYFLYSCTGELLLVLLVPGEGGDCQTGEDEEEEGEQRGEDTGALRWDKIMTIIIHVMIIVIVIVIVIFVLNELRSKVRRRITIAG